MTKAKAARKPPRPEVDELELLYNCNVHVSSRTLLLYGPITPARALEFTKNMLVLSSTDQEISVLLNTPGGSVIDGFAIFDLISQLPNHVTITVLGEAASMGAIILQAADLRVMAPNASLMMHDGSLSVIDMQARDFQRLAKFSSYERERFYKILAERSRLSVAQIRARMANDWYMSPEEAKAEGLVDYCLDDDEEESPDGESG